jgi:hypothetical protein
MAMLDINHKTTIPILWLVMGLSCGAGGVFWLTSIYSTASQAKEYVEKLDVKLENKMHSIDKKMELLHSMDRRLSRIEGGIDKLLKSGED